MTGSSSAGPTQAGGSANSRPRTKTTPDSLGFWSELTVVERLLDAGRLQSTLDGEGASPSFGRDSILEAAARTAYLQLVITNVRLRDGRGLFRHLQAYLSVVEGRWYLELTFFLPDLVPTDDPVGPLSDFLERLRSDLAYFEIFYFEIFVHHEDAAFDVDDAPEDSGSLIFKT